MDIRPIYSVKFKKTGSDKTLIQIDGLNEADKVFKQFKFSTKGEGYDKCLILYRDYADDLLLKRKPLA